MIFNELRIFFFDFVVLYGGLFGFNILFILFLIKLRILFFLVNMFVLIFLFNLFESGFVIIGFLVKKVVKIKFVRGIFVFFVSFRVIVFLISCN